MTAHGTRSRYLTGPDENDRPGKGCRCDACKAENTRRGREYRARKAREQWGAEPLTTDAEPARQHVRTLMDAGIGWQRVAELAGVGCGTVASLLYGLGERPPTRRVRTTTARRLLAVQPGAIADGRMIPAVGTIRRLQALISIGWTGTQIARRLGQEPTNFPQLMARRFVRLSTARQIAALYDELWNTPPPADTEQQRRAATYSRNRAAANGWAPPMAWDDDAIDDPRARPHGVPRKAAAS